MQSKTDHGGWRHQIPAVGARGRGDRKGGTTTACPRQRPGSPPPEPAQVHDRGPSGDAGGHVGPGVGGGRRRFGLGHGGWRGLRRGQGPSAPAPSSAGMTQSAVDVAAFLVAAGAWR